MCQGTFFFTRVSRSYASRSLEDMNNVFLSFSKKAAWFSKDGCLMKAVSGTWNFSGHQATLAHGCDSEAQPEHGCEFAPVAGKNNILIKILSAAYNFYVAFLFEEP